MPKRLIKSKKLVGKMRTNKTDKPSMKKKSNDSWYTKLPQGGWSTKNNKVFVDIDGSKVEVSSMMRVKQAIAEIEKNLRKDGYGSHLDNKDIMIRGGADDEQMQLHIEAGGDAEDIDEGEMYFAISDAVQKVFGTNKQIEELFKYDTMNPENFNWNYDYGEDTTNGRLSFTNPAFRYTPQEIKDLKEEFPEIFGLEEEL